MNLVKLGLILVALGISLVFLGSIKSGNAEYAGLVMIGPVPIVFGNSKNAIYLVLGMGVLMMIVMWFILSQIQM